MQASELQAFKRILDRAGVPRDAPPDWLPAEPTALMVPEQRALYAELREQARRRVESRH